MADAIMPLLSRRDTPAAAEADAEADEPPAAIIEPPPLILPPAFDITMPLSRH